MKRSVPIVITLLVTLFAALWMAGFAGASRSAELLAPASPAADASLTSGEGVIAYVKRSTGDIHVVSPDGTNDRVLWTNPDPDHTPLSLAWRPDGGELAFSSQHEWQCSVYDSDVYAIRSDGTGYRRITNAPACAELAGLPKGSVTLQVMDLFGTSYVYVAGAPGLVRAQTGTMTLGDVADLGPGVLQPAVGIAVLDRVTGRPPYADVLPGQTVAGGSLYIDDTSSIRGWGAGEVSWKADGAMLSYNMRTGHQINAIAPVPTYGIVGNALPLAPNASTSHHSWNPTLAGSDQYLYYSTDMKSDQAHGIFLNTVGDTSGGTRLYHPPPLVFQILNDVEWLPDGSGFLFSLGYMSGWDPIYTCAGQDYHSCYNIFEYDLATHRITQRTDIDDKSVMGMVVSPDGQHIVFERTTDPVFDPTSSLWIINRDGTGLRKLIDDAGRPAWGKVSAPPPSTATPTRTPGGTATPTATRPTPTDFIYLPLVLRSFAAPPATSTPTSTPAGTATPTPTRTPSSTPTATPANEGINGRVTYKGAAAPGIELQLRFYDGSQTTTAATTTTDGEGRYRFAAAASLGPGQEYWVRFLSPDNPAYVSSWQTASITAYTSGSAAPGGDFDIANVNLLSPPDDAAQALPVTFTWQQRGIPGDTYLLVFFDPDTDDYWYTADLGNVGSFTVTGLWPEAVFGKQYGWVVWVYNGPDSLGASYYYQTVTFLSGRASSPAPLEPWQIGGELREPGLMDTRP